MDLEIISCERCGAELTILDDHHYRCSYCGATYEKDDLDKQIEALSSVLDAQKQENVAAIRRQLWSKTQEEYVDASEIARLAHELRGYLPEDFLGSFYEFACADFSNAANEDRLCHFLEGIDVSEHYSFIGTVIDFMLKSMTARIRGPLLHLIERAYAQNDLKLYAQYRSRYDEEAAKIDDCLYDPEYHRDVYVCYANEDIAQVEELVNLLEGNGFSCYYALRNMQRGSVHNYFEIIQKAIDNCDTVVFVSSTHSRNLECPAIRELDYIKSSDRQRDTRINRIEYSFEHYVGGSSTRVENRIKDFFKNLSQTITPDEVLQRLLDLELQEEEAEEEAKQEAAQAPQNNSGFPINETVLEQQIRIAKELLGGAINPPPAPADPSEKEVKYCKYCGAENPIKNRHCCECGQSSFVDTREEFVRGLEQSRKELFEMARREAEDKARSLRDNTAIYVPAPQTSVRSAQVPVEEPSGPRNHAGERRAPRGGDISFGPSEAAPSGPRNRAGEPPRNHAGERRDISFACSEPSGPRNRAGEAPRERCTRVEAPSFTPPPRVTSTPIQVGQRLIIPPEIGKLSVRSSYQYKMDGVTVNCCVFLLNAESKVLGDNDFVFFNNENSLNNSVRLTSDTANATDTVNVNLGRVHYDVERIRFVYSVFSDDDRKVNFSMVKCVNLSLVIGDSIYTYEFTDIGREKSIIAFDLYKHKNAWKANMIARPTAQDIGAVCKELGVDVA